ncbi:unnamed protein product [Bursaphelenchus xylophilus]|uniref:(pine wood nematode) hypothetical protein n=1 Tax=Bursaphelenchus xylophilus TaxID=6326 RepID=A0A1I7SUE1_BURXY|nr:unnamed protein product [Bursaphelenchus xylophilus]CAG9107240.1 unnamed protein product [Bursaphelenchus xylophilus]
MVEQEESPSSSNDLQLELKEKLEAAKQLTDRYEKMLQEERTYRQELERVFEKKSKEAETSTFQLNEQIQSLERLLDNLSAKFNNEMKIVEEKFDELLSINQSRLDDFNTVNEKYQKLLGLYRKNASNMREDNISLPQTVDELQFECLKLREEIIETRSAKEHIEEEKASAVAALNSELEQARAMSGRMMRTQENEELRQTICDLEKRLSESQAEAGAMAKSLEEFRQRCSQLQVELDNSEAVQKDFVRLSQNLQIQLEKIRSTEQEVRWQFAEDVAKCNSCEADIRRTTQKGNCLHCGKVFCTNCIKQQISTGPNNRIAKVCSVCHTLLNRNSAPFFSKTFTSPS